MFVPVPEAGAGGIEKLPPGEVVKGDYFAYGDVVEVSGVVDGDVYAAGAEVLVDGTVRGDLLAAGGTVRVAGEVLQDARVVGGEVVVSGTVSRNLSAAGGRVHLTRSSWVEGNVVVAGSEVVVSGPVGGSVRASAGVISVSSPLGGSLEAAGGEIRLERGARVQGDFTYWSSEEAEIDRGAEVTGTVARTTPYAPEPEGFTSLLVGAALALKVVSTVSTLAAGLLLVFFFPGFAERTVSTLKARPWSSAGAGFLVLVVVPVVCIILAVTVVGIPLALILGALYLITVYLSKIVVIYWAGGEVFSRFGRTAHRGWVYAVGLIAYTALTLLPLAGGVAAIIATLTGLGAIILAQRELYSEARGKGTL